MKTYIFLATLSMIIGCKQKTSISNNENIETFVNSLINNKTFLLKDTILIGISQKQMIIAKKRPFKDESWIMFHEVDKEGSFVNRDYEAISDTLDLGRFDLDTRIFVENQNLSISKCEKIRIGEYYRDAIGRPINIWSIDIDYKDLIEKNNPENGEYFLGIKPQEFYFNFLKKQGVFFKTSGDVYVWYYNNTIFFVRNKVSHKGRKVMFHILKENKFENLDFDFNQKISKKLVLSKEYEVAEYSLQNDIDLHNIRLGEYFPNDVNNTNIWAQEIDMTEVFTNELLRFQNDIGKAPIK